MNRRQFLKNTAPLGMLPLLGAGLPIGSVSASSPFLANSCNVTDRSVVILYLNGGNDIFNTTVPLSQYSTYYNLRPSLALPETSLIELDSTLPDEQRIGLHPVLGSFKDLYDSGKMSIIQRAGYEKVNGSHFRSLDNWLQGSGGDEHYSDGMSQTL